MKDSVIIVSGGMDSITLLYDKKDEIALGISFNYGSNHNEREIPFAKMHCERLGIKHITIDLGFISISRVLFLKVPMRFLKVIMLLII